MVNRSSGTAVKTLAELAQSLIQRLPELAERTLIAIHATDEVYRARGLVGHDELRQSIHDNLLEHLRTISILPRGEDSLRDSARATATRRAEQGLPLESLLRAYRLGGRVIWEGLLEECRRRPEPPKDELLEAAVLVWDITDEYSAEVARVYREAEEKILSRDKLQRETLLRSLLTGMATERDLGVAQNVLDLPEDGSFVVAVADAAEQDVAATIRALAGALSVAGARSEWLQVQQRAAGLVAIAEASGDTVAVALRNAGAYRIGLSPTVHGFGQVAVAYRQAELALRSIPPRRVELASLDSRLSNALLVASPDLARRLAHHVLGPIFDLAADERELLLSSLATVVDVKGSIGDAARALACHRNTVLNRLRRVQQLTGLSTANPVELVQLSLALQAMELLAIDTGHRAEP